MASRLERQFQYKWYSKHMDYRAWSKKHLKRVALRELGKTTSVWCTKKSDKPLLVLVHGISGDHSGLVPLAVELAASYRLAIVELPGHGKSSVIRLPDATSLQRWFDGVLEKVKKEIGRPTYIIAHSFGCSAVLSKSTLEQYKIILINPVPTPTEMYSRYARVIMRSASFWAYIYNWRFFIYLRGTALIKNHTRAAKKRVYWVGRQSRPTYTQTVFQAGLVDMILDGSAYQYAGSGKVRLVICGMFDTTAKQRDSLDIKAVFGATDVVFLRGGHLLPIEDPERTAAVLRSAMLH